MSGGAWIGRVLGGRYEVQRLLASGAHGDVFEAVQLDLGRRVALKLLTGPLDAESAERLRREALTLGKLNHPHVVQALDLGGGEGGEPSWIVMERLDGMTLAALLAAGERFTPARAARIALHVLSALEAAHDAGIIHRDVRPAKVFVQPTPASGELVKLVGFGLARAALAAATQTIDARAGEGETTEIAPERLARAAAAPTMDVYGVGVCLRAMLGEGGDEAIRGIASRAVERDPARRLATAREMREALEAWRARGGRAREAAPAVRRLELFGMAAIATLLAGAFTLVTVVDNADWATRRTAPAVSQVPAVVDAADEEDAWPKSEDEVVADDAAARRADDDDARAEAGSPRPDDADRPSLRPTAPAGPRRLPRCTCIYEGPVLIRLCNPPPPASCSCDGEHGTVFPRHAELEPGGVFPKSSVWPPDPRRKAGDPCSGYAYTLDGARVAATGRFNCLYCYGTDVASGVPWGACRGVNPNGEWKDGRWYCDGAGPRPPR